MAAHELGHIFFGLCDQYSYRAWKRRDNLLRKEKSGKGCPNAYDPLGCCQDNPKWWAEGKFDRESYEKNLKGRGMGPHCLPKNALENSECKREIEGLGVDISKREKSKYFCFGNPCSLPDLGPPYCRDVIAGAIATSLNACFGGKEVERRVIKEQVRYEQR